MATERPEFQLSPELPNLPESFKTKKWQGLAIKDVLVEIAREYPINWMRFGEYRSLPLEIKDTFEAHMSWKGGISNFSRKEILYEDQIPKKIESLKEVEKHRRQEDVLWSPIGGYEPIDFLLRDKGVDFGWEMAFKSVVCLEDETWVYVPTLDLICEPNVGNLEKIKSLFDSYMTYLLGPSEDERKGNVMGVFIYSGNSFQYCGLNLVKRWQWENFLKRSLYVLVDRNPDGTKKWLVDPAWVGHSLEQKSADLRLTNITRKKPIVPVVINVWTNSLQDNPLETVSR
jgi:hypothetical protein